jgi:serine/threonine protein kinase
VDTFFRFSLFCLFVSKIYILIFHFYRPENVLLDHRGNVRLTDFGLSKEGIADNDSGAHSFCGTPEYLAPEILNRSGHGRGVDWWSLGALLYEMLTGLPPFYSRDRNTLFDRIKRGVLLFPSDLSEPARDLLAGLLTRDASKRLGCGIGDAAEVKSHPFFASIDWEALLECRIPPPWTPAVASSLDTSQFDAEFTNMPLVSPKDTTKEGSVSTLLAKNVFPGFTYVAPPAIVAAKGVSVTLQNMNSGTNDAQSAYQKEAFISNSQVSHMDVVNNNSSGMAIDEDEKQ